MATLYVRKSGNDANDGSTPALAKLTISSAITASSNGDTIYVGAGVYKEKLEYGYKAIHIIGDETGEQMGDAGVCVLSGLNATNDGYNFTTDSGAKIDMGYSTHEFGVALKNFEISDWYRDGLHTMLRANSYNLRVIIIENIRFRRLFARQEVRAIQASSLGGHGQVHQFRNILVDNLQSFDVDTNRIMDFNGTSLQPNTEVVWENIEVRNIFLTNSSSSLNPHRINGLVNFGVHNATNVTARNITISNVTFARSQALGTHLDVLRLALSGTGSYTVDNVNVNNALCWAPYSTVITVGIAAESNITVNNYNVFEVLEYYNGSIRAGTPTAGSGSFVNGNALAPMWEIAPSKLSRFSPIRGLGNAEQAPADIFGNPRPAYGNTNGDIGHAENTYDDVQREATIKDSGDYSMRVQRPNWFKKTFQIPVTASELRTVKVKVRIDGTWGTTRPKVTLSGQGMAVSSATKDATTGVFHELTVSGTPTSTGIALLTIEAHVAPSNTDAIMYVDTVTIS